jgi:hypothetical protein
VFQACGVVSDDAGAHFKSGNPFLLGLSNGNEMGYFDIV